MRNIPITKELQKKIIELSGLEKDLTYSGHYFIVIRRCDRSSIKTLFSLIDKNNQSSKTVKRKFDTPKPILARPLKKK